MESDDDDVRSERNGMALQMVPVRSSVPFASSRPALSI